VVCWATGGSAWLAGGRGGAAAARFGRLAPGVLEELDAAGTLRSRLTALAIRQRLGPLTSEQRREVAFVAGIRPEPAV